MKHTQPATVAPPPQQHEMAAKWAPMTQGARPQQKPVRAAQLKEKASPGHPADARAGKAV